MVEQANWRVHPSHGETHDTPGSNDNACTRLFRQQGRAMGGLSDETVRSRLKLWACLMARIASAQRAMLSFTHSDGRIGHDDGDLRQAAASRVDKA